MSEKVIGRQRDNVGRTRFYFLKIETENGFRDLVKFVAQEFRCEFGELDEGPGTMVQRGRVDGKDLVFVLSDSTGAQVYAENEDDVDLIERIARRVEARTREVMKSCAARAKPTNSDDA